METIKSPENLRNTHLLDVKSACNYLGIGRTTLYLLINTGAIPKVKLVQGRTQFLQEDLDAYINSKKAKYTSNVL